MTNLFTTTYSAVACDGCGRLCRHRDDVTDTVYSTVCDGGFHVVTNTGFVVNFDDSPWLYLDLLAAFESAYRLNSYNAEKRREHEDPHPWRHGG